MVDGGQSELKIGERSTGRQLMDGLDHTLERMRANPLRVASWCVVLVWFGVSLLLMTQGVIKAVVTPEAGGDISAAQRGWAVFAWGGGAIALVEALLRLIVPRWREPAVYPFVWGVVWIAVGFSLWYNSWDALGPIGIIGLGLVALGWTVLWQKKGLSKALEQWVKRIKESPVRFIAVAALVIWFGVSLLLMAQGVVKGVITPEAGGDVSASQRGWAIFAFGGAVIFCVETLVRLIVPRWRQPSVYSFIWALIWLAVGLSLWFNNWTALAPIVFIGLGLTLLGLLLPRPAK